MAQQKTIIKLNEYISGGYGEPYIGTREVLVGVPQIIKVSHKEVKNGSVLLKYTEVRLVDAMVTSVCVVESVDEIYKLINSK